MSHSQQNSRKLRFNRHLPSGLHSWWCTHYQFCDLLMVCQLRSVTSWWYAHYQLCDLLMVCPLLALTSWWCAPLPIRWPPGCAHYQLWDLLMVCLIIIIVPSQWCAHYQFCTHFILTGKGKDHLIPPLPPWLQHPPGKGPSALLLSPREKWITEMWD